MVSCLTEKKMEKVLPIITRLIAAFLLGWFTARIIKRIRNAGGLRKFIESMYGSSKDWSEFPDEAAKKLNEWRKKEKADESKNRKTEESEGEWKWCTPQHVDCDCKSCKFLKKLGVYKFRGMIWVGMVVFAGIVYFLTRP